jgi:hypothetical protein
MPIAFAPWIGFAVGACFAWVAAPEIERHQGGVAASRPFVLVLSFAGLVWLPVVGYFLAFHGDWSYLYLVPWRRVPSAIDLLLALSAAGAVLLGFAAAVRPVRQRRTLVILSLIGTPMVIALAALPFAARRLAVSASYAQFHGDFGVEPVPGSLLGKGVLVMGSVLTVALAWTFRSLLRLAADADK